MSEQIDWSKAPEWAKWHGLAGEMKSQVWFDDEKYSYVDGRQDGQSFFYCDAVTHSSQDFSHVTICPATPSWSGEGLPPVGVVCEYNPMPVGKPKKWHKVEVVYASEWVIVMRCIWAPNGHEGGNGVEIAMAVDNCSLEDVRPIRTPEQIAADDREAQIVAIHDAIVTSVKVTLGQCDSWRKVAEMVYNAGFKRE